MFITVLTLLMDTTNPSGVTQERMKYIDRKIILCKSGMSRIQCLLACQVNEECRYSAEAEKNDNKGYDCVHFGEKLKTSDLLPPEWKALTKMVKGMHNTFVSANQ